MIPIPATHVTFLEPCTGELLTDIRPGTSMGSCGHHPAYQQESSLWLREEVSLRAFDDQSFFPTFYSFGSEGDCH